MAAIVNLNGIIADEAHAVISVFDHGFLYGEGVYETLRTYHGQPFLFDRHMHRLRRSAGMLALPIPLSDAEIDARFRDTMRAAGLDGGPNSEAYIRMLVTRGVGDLSYDLGVCLSPSIVVIVKPQVDPPADVYERGVAVVIVSTVRNHPGTVNPMIKSNNLLNNALAMQEAVKTRRLRRGDAELPRRARRMHDVQPVRRQERRRADAAARGRPAARHHARVPVRGRRRARRSRFAKPCCATRISSAPTRRS